MGETRRSGPEKNPGGEENPHQENLGPGNQVKNVHLEEQVIKHAEDREVSVGTTKVENIGVFEERCKWYDKRKT